MARGLFVLFYVLKLLANRVDAAGMQCLSESGKPVDWFIVYKLPAHVSVPDNSAFYMDTNQLSWQRQEKTMDQSGHAVYNTLNQIYGKAGPKNRSTSDILYAMYNDQDPHTRGCQSGGLGWSSASTYGHTKGVVAFDTSTGFWMVHSTPCFPPPRVDGYTWLHKSAREAQTFLCVSMATDKNLDIIGKQLLYNYPDIYDKDSPAYFDKFPSMTSAMSKHHVTDAPWYNEAEMTSLAGTTFYSFATFSKFDEDLYGGWLAPRFQDSLYVETWQSGSGGKLSSNCTGPYRVYNVASVAFKSPDVEFTETKDHSKWAVTKDKHVTCIGDINRMESQEKRAGGTVCFKNDAVWKSFHGIIDSTRSCGVC